MNYSFALLSCVALLPALVFGQSTAQPQEAISALEAKFSAVPGKRRNHTKGQCFSGTFKASPDAQLFTKSLFFDGQSVPVVGRFSHAGGNLEALDSRSKVYGMALRFKRGQAYHSMAMLNLPYFDVASPEGFIAKIKALTPASGESHADPMAIQEYHQKHPESQRLKGFLKDKIRVPKGWPFQAFNSIHSFFVHNARGQKQAIRWSFEPELGVRWYEGGVPPAEFLVKQLTEHLQRGAAYYRMEVSLPAKEDDINDPSKPWLTTGQKIDFGRLTIARATGECDGINFDPLQLSEGFSASADPVLRFRSPAYAISFAKRLSEKSQGGK